MLRVVFLIMIAFAFLGCGDGTETETETETSPVSPTVDWELLLQDRGNWELLATLERDVRQRFWHLFHVQSDIEPLILQAFADGKEFLFVIKHPRVNSTQPIQFYFAQPEPAWDDETESVRVDLYYPSEPTWFDHWGPETNIGGRIKREESGFVAVFDLGAPGWKFLHPDNQDQDWIGGSVEFRATREGASIATSYTPHIKEGYVLNIYVR